MQNIFLQKNLYRTIPENLQKVFNHIKDYPSFYSQCIHSLFHYETQLTRTEARYALETILAVALLETNAQNLAKIPEENLRNKYITELTGLIAEPGLIPGNTEEEVLNQISMRVQELQRIFFFDKKRSDEVHFFKEGFIGPPCFNGRILSMQRYESEKQLLQPFSEASPDDNLACQMEELMYEYLDLNEKDTKDPPSLQEMKEYVQKQKINIFPQEKFEKIYNRAVEFFVLSW
ncbi:MAG: hypothetical protein Tsb0015_07710 [Simkaniaceae bacterium]